MALPQELELSRLREAHLRSAEVVTRTPALTARSISERLGAELVLKAESLQRTGSFKLRGALNKLRSVSEPLGVVAGSAGNHAQSLAYAARAFGVACEVFMPRDASIGKLAAVRAFGAAVHQEGLTVDDSVTLARARAEETGFVFAHPFDDLDVIAGQAGVGIEVLEQEPDVDTVIVPVGGGGLICGVAAAVRQMKPGVRVVGVQTERCAPFLESPDPGAGTGEAAMTIADGIAVKRPGTLTRPLVEGLVDDIVTVSEEWIAEAMALLLERSKLMVEGAGAASLAAALSGAVECKGRGPTVVVLSGGNVDIGLVARITGREEARQGRRLRLFTRISDRPGGSARLLATVAEAGANLIAVEHVRESIQLEVWETGIALTLETRGHKHVESLRAALRAEGYESTEI
ncbi:MAG: threonine ammonia-lyase [Solirubrobacterales bacterium]